MDKEELIDFLHSAIKATSAKLGIQNADWKTSKELIEEIKNLNQDIYQSLDEFIDAYVECYKDWSTRNIEIRNNTRNEMLRKLNDFEGH
jgi:hypothetical protein